MREANVQTSHGLELVGRSETALRTVGEDSATAATNVRAITDAVREQDAAVHQVASSIENIAQMTEQHSAAARSAEDTARRLDQFADGLRSSVARFKT